MYAGTTEATTEKRLFKKLSIDDMANDLMEKLRGKRAGRKAALQKSGRPSRDIKRKHGAGKGGKNTKTAEPVASKGNRSAKSAKVAESTKCVKPSAAGGFSAQTATVRMLAFPGLTKKPTEPMEINGFKIYTDVTKNDWRVEKGG